MTGTRIPAWALAVGALGTLFIVVPLGGMVANVEWPRFGALIAQPASVSALVLSLGTSALSTLLCVLLGVPVALLLARTRIPGQRALRALVLLPLVLPPVVGGIALLFTYGRRGLLGAGLDAVGIQLGFSTAAVVLAQTFVAVPFLILSVEGALRTTGIRYERVASTLGAGPSRVLLRVTLPVIAPALVTGTILSFARALGEFGATITFAGSLPGTTQTLPLALYFQLQTDPAAAVALSLLLVAVSMLIVGLAYLRRDRARMA